MDSTGIGLLIGRYKNLKPKGISFYVQNPNPTIDKIFRISGLYGIMPLLETRG
jgi:stage II sporulation protein AA (anti-sigma F factor antagonist)